MTDEQFEKLNKISIRIIHVFTEEQATNAEVDFVLGILPLTWRAAQDGKMIEHNDKRILDLAAILEKSYTPFD